MTGVNWDERREGWWLASNGKWYPPQDQPAHWSTTALPPAPEHRDRRSAAAMITSRTKKLRETVSDALEDRAQPAHSSPGGSGWTAGSDSGRRPPPPPPSSSRTPAYTGAGVADAAVTSSSSYSSRLSSGMPPPPALASPDDFPDPPGRFSEGDDGDDDPDRIS